MLPLRLRLSCALCLNACMWAGVSRVIFSLSKEKLSNVYYGGNYATKDINSVFLKQIEIVHLKELEDISLAIVQRWEKQFETK